ncbi:hypothetical protein PJO54_29095, partial [Mycobacterium kansasii]
MTQQPVSDQDLFPQGTVEPEYSLNDVLDTDAAGVYADVTDEDRAHWMRARAFVQDELLGVIHEHWDRGEYPLDLVA